MANIYKLRNQVKHYEWGSPDLIPRMLGLAYDDTPVAELWMGNDSTVDAPDKIGGKISLGEIIAAEQYGGLPFLFKLLAAEKPLSIQVHPNREQAREGFERENTAGVPLDAPNRNYRDPNHKPEIICALSPFTGMCGFRSPAAIRRLFSIFRAAPIPLQESIAPILQALENPEPETALRNFTGALFRLSATVREVLTEYVLSVSGGSNEWELAQKFAQAYPGDMAMLAPLYLNVFHLEPGEALFLQAGVPHAYIHGFGVELMANSDNVLRGGLTAKHIDIPELMKVLNYKPLEPQIIKPQAVNGCFTYPIPCEEFSLTVMRGGNNASGADGGAGGGGQQFTPNAPSICIVTEGEVSIGDVILKQGESAFIPTGDDPLVLQGNYTLYVASAGGTASAGSSQ